jgi:hypothetical protein
MPADIKMWSEGEEKRISKNDGDRFPFIAVKGGRRMSTTPLFRDNLTQLDIGVLTDEVVKLLRMNLDNLYTTLGGQLLATVRPSAVAGIVSYLAAARSAAEATSLHDRLPLAVSLRDWSEGLGVICEELKQDGIRYVSGVKTELKEALSNEDLLRLGEQAIPSHIQIILMVVAAVLRLPRDLDTISATITAILLKQGLRNLLQ